METGKKLIMVIKKKKNYFPRNVGENMKEKKDRILFNYFIIGFEIFIFICLEGMIYPVRNTDDIIGVVINILVLFALYYLS